MRIHPTLWLAVALSAVLACGEHYSGGSTGDTCASAPAQPCGGSIVPGTYVIAGSCSKGLSAAVGPFCPGTIITIDSAHYSGSITFAADGTYLSVLTADTSETFVFPLSCMTTSSSDSTTCAHYGEQLSSLSGADVTKTDCSGTTDCVCKVSVRVNNKSESGTYSTSGTNLTMQENGSSSSSPIPFCVSADGAQITFFSPGAAPAPTTVLSRK